MIVIPKKRKRSLLIFGFVGLFLFAFIVMILILGRNEAIYTTNPVFIGIKKSFSGTSKSPFNKSMYSTTDPASQWVIVNKQHPLNPLTYAPADLVSSNGGLVSRKMAPSLNSLMSDAKFQDIALRVVSGYRSYDDQVSLYNSYVVNDGQTKADTYSARPGYSEHQIGLAVDLGGSHGCDAEECFGATPEAAWLAQNAFKYGFIIRYNVQNKLLTGYEAEPWHLRYVGNELAQELKDQNINSLEQFFGMRGGSIYSR